MHFSLNFKSATCHLPFPCYTWHQSLGTIPLPFVCAFMVPWRLRKIAFKSVNPLEPKRLKENYEYG